MCIRGSMRGLMCYDCDRCEYLRSWSEDNSTRLNIFSGWRATIKVIAVVAVFKTSFVNGLIELFYLFLYCL